MDERSIDGITNRLEKLEVQNRRLKRFNIVICLLLFIGTAVGWKLSTDERLEITDKQGTVRFEMSIDPQNIDRCGLFIYDSKGKLRVDLGVSPQGNGGMIIRDRNGNVTFQK